MTTSIQLNNENNNTTTNITPHSIEKNNIEMSPQQQKTSSFTTTQNNLLQEEEEEEEQITIEGGDQKGNKGTLTKTKTKTKESQDKNEIDNCSEMYQYLENHDFICPVDQDQVNGSVIWTIIKRLSNGADLTRIALPVSILRPASLLEILAIYSTPKLILKNINRSKKVDRMKRVVAWFTSGLAKAPQNKVFGTKPYNPILGETFECSWNNFNDSKHDSQDDSLTTFQAEQVSHHPPVSSFHMENRQHGFQYFGTFEARTMFRGNSVDTELSGLGYIVLTLGENGEQEVYCIESMPSMSAQGLVWGNQRVALKGKLKITCQQTSLSTVLDVSTSDPKLLDGYLSEMQTSRSSMSYFGFVPDKQLYKVHADIYDHISFQSKNDKQDRNDDDDDGDVRFEFKHFGEPKRNVNSVSQQKPNESRRVWHKVTKAIYEGNEDKANYEKDQVEEEQRRIRKIRHNQGETWNPQLFKYSKEYQAYIYQN